jgi:ubiquinone/menaquinone biosynthesis C-methylase UbiE
MLNGLKSDIKLVEVREGILSALQETERASEYDSKVWLYDLVVGNRYYNKLIWGNWPSNYSAFCKQALNDSSGKTVLDAGCGSLVFTADVYAESDCKAIILLDRSLDMLQKGRKRLIEIMGSIPENIHFIQGDIFALPFKDSCFDVVMSQGVIHLFKDQLGFLTELERVKKAQGRLFFSSLVANNWLAEKYMQLIKNSGEVATTHSGKTWSKQLEWMPFRYQTSCIGNMAYAHSA